MGSNVLVSGATGFIGLHTVIEALKAGHKVRGTLRSPERENEVRESVARQVDANDRLSLHVCDLTQDDGWTDAINGCDYVLHVASPFPLGTPDHEDDLIIPARDGVLRVLRAAADAGVKRTVLTSSIAAISGGHDDRGRLFNEDDWTDIEHPSVGAYEKSKTIAERAAWDFVENYDGAMELAVINPGAVLGPVLNRDIGTSGEFVRQLMDGAMPGCPRISFCFVDVRDVASAHLAALTNPKAAGQRFICADEFGWMSDIGKILHERFADDGYKIATRDLPDEMVRMAAETNPALKQIAPRLGKERHYDNSRIKDMLGWTPRSLKEMAVDMGESMIDFGVVSPK